MALNTSKPGIISEIDRGLANVLGLQALFLFQEPSGDIRDSLTKTGAALSSGGVEIDQPGLVLTFNGSQQQNLAFTLPIPGSGTLPAAAQNFVIMARFKPTGTPAASPGQIFGICASVGTQGSLGVGTDTSNNVGQTWLSGAGAGIGPYSPAALNEWYTVYAALSGTNGAEQLAWINGVPATTNQGSSTSSGGAGTMNEIAFGAQHRSSGFLRQAKGNLEWGAVLYGVTMTDQLAAELFAADFPYNLLLSARKRVWKSSGAPTGEILSGTSALGSLTSSGQIGAGRSLSGSPSLGVLVSSGTAKAGRALSGTPSLGSLTSSGSATAGRALFGPSALGSLISTAQATAGRSIAATSSLGALISSGVLVNSNAKNTGVQHVSRRARKQNQPLGFE